MSRYQETKAECAPVGGLGRRRAVVDVSPEPVPSPDRAVYLHDIHTFRAVAIIFIVAGHCISLFDWNRRHSHGPLLSSLMPNGTVFFVFIAGFLFQHLSGKFEYRDYMKKKLRNVLLPYLVLSVPILMVQSLLTHGGSFDPAYRHHWSTVAGNVAWSLLTGSHTLGPYWFVPMIALFYLLAPVFLWVDRDGRLYYLLPLVLAVTVFVHRPSDFDHIWQSCAYFLPVYIYGMWFSRYRERAVAWHDRGLPALLTLVVALTWFEVAYLKRAGYIASVAMFSTEHGIVDTNAVQKLLLCGILLVILRRFGDLLHRWLSYIADISFGIYFLHMWFINVYLFSAGTATPAASLLRYGLAVAVTLALSIGCLLFARQLMGRYSRSVVGC